MEEIKSGDCINFAGRIYKVEAIKYVKRIARGRKPKYRNYTYAACDSLKQAIEETKVPENVKIITTTNVPLKWRYCVKINCND